MGFRFTDSATKLRWAEHHRQSLDFELRKWLNGCPYAFAEKLDPKTKWHIFEAMPPLDDDPPVALILGDLLHALRSALDYIAWQLVVDHLGRTRANKARADIYFPITSRDINEFALKPLWKHVRVKDIPLFQERQPYRRGHDPNARFLTLLSSLANEDKHRVIPTVRVTVSDPPPKFVPGEGVAILKTKFEPGKRLVSQAKVARVLTKPRDGQVHMESAAVEIAFGRKPYLMPVDLPLMIAEVQAIVSLFERRYDPPTEAHLVP